MAASKRVNESLDDKTPRAELPCTFEDFFSAAQFFFMLGSGASRYIQATDEKPTKFMLPHWFNELVKEC